MGDLRFWYRFQLDLYWEGEQHRILTGDSLPYERVTLPPVAAIHCGPLYEIQDAVYSSDGPDDFQSHVTVTCPRGLRLNDGHSHVSIRCLADGQWMDHDFYTNCAGISFLLKISLVVASTAAVL
jgi:hypothetical protein